MACAMRVLTLHWDHSWWSVQVAKWVACDGVIDSQDREPIPAHEHDLRKLAFRIAAHYFQLGFDVFVAGLEFVKNWRLIVQMMQMRWLVRWQLEVGAGRDILEGATPPSSLVGDNVRMHRVEKWHDAVFVEVAFEHDRERIGDVENG
eukprot:6211193-Pleurochrysis_carterae.AAC.1